MTDQTIYLTELSSEDVTIHHFVKKSKINHNMNNAVLNYFVDKCKNDDGNQLSNVDLQNIFKLTTNEEINISSHKLSDEIKSR